MHNATDGRRIAANGIIAILSGGRLAMRLLETLHVPSPNMKMCCGGELFGEAGGASDADVAPRTRSTQVIGC
jgi:hypothetical protein